nr:chloramphenicol acetyltransferase-like domain-containing protein [Tanacetum cinerariifolium]
MVEIGFRLSDFEAEDNYMSMGVGIVDLGKIVAAPSASVRPSADKGKCDMNHEYMEEIMLQEEKREAQHKVEQETLDEEALRMTIEEEERYEGGLRKTNRAKEGRRMG